MGISLKRKIKKIAVKKLPIIEWLPQYTWSKFLQDALAGLAVGLTAIPQTIAYAIVAGLPPQYGLYSGFMGCFVYVFFGSAKDITVGPTAITALLVQPYTAKLGIDFVVLLCFLTGCIISLMGILNIGFLVNFISMPVISGFTNAAAIMIATSQVHTLLGIRGKSDTFIESIKVVINNIKDIKLYDTILGVSCMLVLIGLKKLPGSRKGSVGKKIMWLLSLGRNAVVVCIGILLAFGFSQFNSEPFSITGHITGGLPPFSIPPFSTVLKNETYNIGDMMAELGASVASVPLIAILESIAIAKVFAKGRAVDANQEMFALGLCNILGSFFSSFPVTGSFTRTAVNYASGVQTPMGGIVTGSLILLTCGFLTSAFQFIPKATLAAVIMVAMYYMLELRIFLVLWRTKKMDLVLLTTTLISCLAMSLEYGMIIGISVNILSLLYFTARPGLSMVETSIETNTALVVSPQQSLSFPAAEYLREHIMKRCIQKELRMPVIIDATHVYRIDATVAKNLKLLQLDLEARNQKLVFWNLADDVRNTLINYDQTFDGCIRKSRSLSLVFSDSFTTDV